MMNANDAGGREPAEISLNEPASDNSPTRSTPERSQDGTAKNWVNFEETETSEEEGSKSMSGKEAAVLPPPPPRARNKGKEGAGAMEAPGADIAEINVAMEETTPQKKVHSDPEISRDNSIGTTPAPTISQTNGNSNAQPTVNTTARVLPANGGQYDTTNGKKISTILPENHLLPWIIPAKFNVYKIPKSLVSDKVSLPVEDFVTVMRILTNDYRFMVYVSLYRRVIVLWIVFMIVLLFILLLSQAARQVWVFVLVLAWILLIALGILGCLFVKKKIHKALHRCVAEVNQTMSKHNLLIGVEDRGKLSCHKIAIHFIAYKLEDCIPTLARSIKQFEAMEAAKRQVPSVAMVVDRDMETGMEGFNPSAEEKARQLMLKYSQSWVKGLVRHKIKFPSRPSEGVSELAPLHCTTSYCLCQYVQQYHFEKKVEKNFFQRLFFIGDLNIRELETSGFNGGYPAMMYAHM